MKYVILKLVQWAFLALKKVHKCLLKFLFFRKYCDRGRKSESYRSSPRSWNSRQEKTFPSLINYKMKFDVSGCSLTSLRKFCERLRKKVGVLWKQSKLKQQAREDLGRKSESYGCSPSWNSRQEKTFPSLIKFFETKFDVSGCSLTSLRKFCEQTRKKVGVLRIARWTWTCSASSGHSMRRCRSTRPRRQGTHLCPPYDWLEQDEGDSNEDSEEKLMLRWNLRKKSTFMLILWLLHWRFNMCFTKNLQINCKYLVNVSNLPNMLRVLMWSKSECAQCAHESPQCAQSPNVANVLEDIPNLPNVPKVSKWPKF